MTRSLARCLAGLGTSVVAFLVLLPPVAAQRGERSRTREGVSIACTVVGPDRICGREGSPLYYSVNVNPPPPPGGYTYDWTLHTTTTNGCPGTGTTNPTFCGPTNLPTVCIIPGLAPGRFVLKVRVSDGSAESSCCLSINVIEPTSTTTPAAASVCAGSTHTFCTTPSGAGPFTFSWTKNGLMIPGATDSCYTATAGTVGTIDNYCVTATGSGPCGVDYTACTLLTALEQTTVANLPTPRRCEGVQYQFCASTGGTGPFTYSWTKNGDAIPGATDDCYTATAGPGGTVDVYCVTVEGPCGPPITRCGSLTSNFDATASALTSSSACEGTPYTFCTTPGGQGPFTYSWTQNGNPIPGATDDCYTATAGPGGTVDTYCVTVTGACGSAESCGSLASTSNTSTSTFEAASVCESTSETFCVTPGGAGPFSYSWTKNGNLLPGETDSCLTATAGPFGTVDTYCATVGGSCGPPSTSCFELSAIQATQSTSLPSTESGCEGESMTLCTTPSGTGPFGYSWSRNGSTVPGATDSCFTFDLAGSDSEVCVTVTGGCGSVVHCTSLSVQGCGGSHVTLTQGAYGNAGGQFNGQGRVALVEQLLAGGMTVGVVGTRSLGFGATTQDAQCVIDRLPTSGRADPLPDFGDETLDADCQTSPTPLVLQSGRFQNILLGQVITLSLNVRLSAGVTTPNGCTTLATGISSQTICPTMTSQDLLPGPDGCTGTADDVPAGGNISVSIALPVFDSLIAQSLPATVGGLLELGNRALAGLAVGPASLSEISSAVDAINILFDEGRELVGCGP